MRQIVGWEGATALVGIVSGAWQDYVSEGRQRTRPGRAMIVWEYMIERADRELAAVFDGVRSVTINGQMAFVLRDRILMRFKKHDRRLRTSNYQTKAQLAAAQQGYFDGMPGLAHVTCGYVLDKAEAGVERYVIVRSKPGDRWSIDLMKLASGHLTPAQPILPGMERPEELAPLPGIVRRVKAHEGSDQ